MNSIDVIADLIRMGKFIFSSEDLRKIYNMNAQQVSRLLRKLEKSKAIRRIHRGLFILDKRFLTGIPIEIIISSLMKDKRYYLGLYTALKYWRLVDVVLTEHFILTPERASKTKYEIDNFKVRIIKIKDTLFFGYVKVPMNAHLVNISNTEKTILDSIYFQEYVSMRDVIKAFCRIRDKINVKKLIDYTIKFNKSSVIQRVGYILEKLAIAKSNELKKLKEYVSKRYFWLDVKGPKIKIEKDDKWRVLCNLKVQCA